MFAPRFLLVLAGSLIFASPASAGTSVYIQNNTPFAFSVEISRPGGLALGSQYWKPGAKVVNPGERRRIIEFNRDKGVKSGKFFEFHERLTIDGSAFTLKQRLKGTTFHSQMWQAVQGHSWSGDRKTYSASWNAANNRFDIKYRAYFTGGSDDIEYILQYRYPAAATAPHTLNVLAYNTYMRPTLLFKNGQALRQKLMMPELKNRGYDVLILSEMFDDDIRAATRKDLRSEFPYATKVVGQDKGPYQDGGVIILSKWPITKWAERLFGSVSAGSDSLSDKGIMYARINKQGKTYHVFGTHTQADKAAKDVAARKQQIQILRAFIDSQGIPATEAVIIGGDLNVDMKNQGEYNFMLSTLNATHPARIGRLAFTWDPRINTTADSGAPEFLDYVLFSRGHLRPVQAVNEVRLHRSWTGWKWLATDRERWDLSDHFAVFGRFVFQN